MQTVKALVIGPTDAQADLIHGWAQSPNCFFHAAAKMTL